MNNIFWYVGGFIFVLTPIVLIHELGHFIAAKMSGIRVLQFGIGFPPVAVKLFERNGTEYVLGWIPLGGFVRPAGEDDPMVEGGLAASSKRARLVTLAAGSVFNIILTIFIFTLLFTLPRPTQIAIGAIAPNSPAETGGLQENDILLAVNGLTLGETNAMLIDEVKKSAGKELTLLVNRDGTEQTITATPRLPEETPEGEGSLGIVMKMGGITARTGVIPAFGVATQTTWGLMRQM
ncbi:MAG: regulator of sigma E protease, partial [Candidatus Promineifilaceae bacterium]